MTKFYTNVELKGNSILYRGYENGTPVSKKIPYCPHVFIPKKGSSEWKSFSSNKFLEKKEFENITSFKEYISMYSAIENFNIYGCEDIVRQFVGNTFRGEIAWDYTLVSTWFFDIETKAENGFPDPSIADQEILLITLMHRNTGKIYTWSTKGVSQDNAIWKYDVDYRVFESEKALLKDFLLFFASNRIDVLTGWNSELFDLPYIVNRIKNVLGQSVVSMLSPWKDVKERKFRLNDKEHKTYTILGVDHLDYLDLYKKFNPGSQESFKLDHIAFIELGERKVEMPCETFKEFYRDHWETFVHYNLIDVKLLYDMEAKIMCVRLAMQLAYLAKCAYGDVISAMRLWESIIYNYFLDEGIVEDLKKVVNQKQSIVGAYVHDPIPGKYGWTVSIDATSLYPSIMMQNNISPECIVGMEDYFIDGILEGKHIGNVAEGTILSANGLVTSKDKIGFIPTLVKRMFDLRKETKNKMLELKKSHADEMLYAALDVAQQSFKVAANSFYGIMSMQYFKYYDYRMGEAITSTGQVFIKKTKQSIDSIINKLLGTINKQYATYLDTDSCYFNVDDLVKKYCKGKTDQEIVTFIEKVVQEVITPAINKDLKAVALTLGIDDCKIDFKLECIGPSVIYVAKKRYCFDILYSEGVRYSQPKMKVIGIEIVRSSTPSVVKDYLKDAVAKCLRSNESDLQSFVKDVKHTFMKQDYNDISFPRGVNGMTTYSDSASIYGHKTPIHVRGSLLYNHHLKRFGIDKNYPIISDGDKVKFIALKKPNPIYEDVIAFPAKLPQELGLHKYFDYETQFKKAFLSPLEGILEAIGWTAEELVTLDSMFD